MDETKYYRELVDNLRGLSDETEWVEFKVNNEKPDMIGEYLSAVSNSAAILDKEKGYIIWGIDNDTHDIVGTKFKPKSTRIGNEEFEGWLARLLNPRIDFKFVEFSTEYGDVSLIEVQRATFRPTAFKGMEFIRVGSYKKPLKDYPEKERKLWLSFETKPYDLRVSLQNLDAAAVTEMLDCAAYYTLRNLPLPANRDGIIHDMIDNQFINKMDNGRYEITNLGGLLFAKDLTAFDNLKRKAIRVIRYKGDGRTTAILDEVFTKGYAVQFDEVTRYIMTLIPQEEEIGIGLREKHVMFPEKAIREMVSNVMIHQDLTAHGAGPMIEVFDTRIEASSPGSLSVDIDRIIDTVPHSRNEAMAAFLRLVNICEERGSGFDRIEEGMFDLKIPAPKVESGDDFCRTKLYWRANLNDWTTEEIIRTCYLYTCYCYVNEIEVSNAVLRNRFGVESQNAAIVSRIIKNTLNAGKIKLADENSSQKNRKYVPYWA